MTPVEMRSFVTQAAAHNDARLPIIQKFFEALAKIEASGMNMAADHVHFKLDLSVDSLGEVATCEVFVLAGHHVHDSMLTYRKGVGVPGNEHEAKWIFRPGTVEI